MADLEEEYFPAKKKLHVNAASLIDLKAALYTTQQQVKRSDNLIKQNKKVSDKTASIWRRDSKTVKGREVKGHTRKGQSSVRPTTTTQLTPEEQDTLSKSRSILEAKAKLYDKLVQGYCSSDDDSNEDYMVDFTKKSIQLHKSNNTVTTKEDSNKLTDYNNDEWVEYIDSFGRTRTCLSKDLDKMKSNDQDLTSTAQHISRSPTPELLSSDMKRERDRVQWERDANNETTDTVQQDPIHYQNIQNNEVRTHGVGYYQFSEEEDKRKEQLQTLNKLRDHTIDQRSKREQLKAKRQTLLDAKLARIKERKLKREGKDEQSSASIDIAEFNFEEKQTESVITGKSFEETLTEQVLKAKQIAEEEQRLKHIRPWDKGKVNRTKDKLQQFRDERNNEFAPPSSYKQTPPTIINKQTPPTIINKQTTPTIINKQTPPTIIDKQTLPTVINQEITPTIIDKQTPPVIINQEATPTNNIPLYQTQYPVLYYPVYMYPPPPPT